TESGAFCRPGDQTWNVRDDKGALAIEANDAEVRDQGSERIISSFGSRARYRGDEGRLSGVGKAEQSQVGEQTQLEPQGALLTGGTRRASLGRLVPGQSKVDIAHPALAAASRHEPISGLGQIAEKLAGLRVVDQRASRNAELEIRAGLAVLIAPASILAA